MEEKEIYGDKVPENSVNEDVLKKGLKEIKDRIVYLGNTIVQNEEIKVCLADQIRELTEAVYRLADAIEFHAVNDKKMLSMEEVCLLTGLSKSHVYKLNASDELPFYKPGGKIMFCNREDLDEYLRTDK